LTLDLHGKHQQELYSMHIPTVQVYEEQDSNQWLYRGNSIIIGPHGDIIVQANHQQDTLLIADCIPGYYGMTHPAVNHSYLKDRRPSMYTQITVPEADSIKG